VNDTPLWLKIVRVLALLFIIVVMGYPVLWALFSAVKSNEQLVANAFLPPWPIEPQSLIRVWQSGDFVRYFVNTLLITLVSVIGLVPMSAAAGYVFARGKLRYADLLFSLILIGMMIPGQVIMIPVFRMMAELGLRNTLWSVILVHLTWTPFGIFLLRTYYLTVPSDLGDAAVIDGCSEFGVFFRVYLPLALPALVTVAIFNFIWSWNDYIWPLVLIQDPQWFTVQQGVVRFSDQWRVDWSMQNAGLVFSFVIPLVFYLIFRKGIQQGLTRGAVKV
jgi:ABC-type glycerol-3-phosphate transport system permease component